MISEKIMGRVSVENCQKISVRQLGLNWNNHQQISIDLQSIQLTTSKCNYGGFRVWFLCPVCNKRIGVLYRKPMSNLFLCGVCNNLTYQLRKYHRSRNEELIKIIHGIKKIKSS